MNDWPYLDFAQALESVKENLRDLGAILDCGYSDDEGRPIPAPDAESIDNWATFILDIIAKTLPADIEKKIEAERRAFDHLDSLNDAQSY